MISEISFIDYKSSSLALIIRDFISNFALENRY